MMDSSLQGKDVLVNDTTSYNNGSMVVPTQLLSPVSVEAKDVQKVLVDSGYYTQDRLQ